MDLAFAKKLNAYHLILISLALFVVAAFVADPPAVIAAGLWDIFTHPSLLTTDYIEVGGIGAALINAVITGICGIVMMRLSDIKPNGATIMAMWMNIGFSFFGKNIFSMVPVVAGVWVYSRFQREPFINYSLVALLSTTLSPVVSEFRFAGAGLLHPALNLVGGILLGMLVGFFIPIIANATNRVHGGYSLYNIGFAGGLVAVFLVAFRQSVGLDIQTAMYVSRGNNLFWGVFLFSQMLLWCAFSLLDGDILGVLPSQKKILRHSGRLVTDFYLLYGHNAYFNMGIMGMLGTAATLLLGAELNGVTLAGIFTMMGFGAFGKHLRNAIPVMAGAIIFAYINEAPPTEPANICAILFCTGLAPVAGQYGWFWGLVAGMLHCTIVSHVGLLTGGLNLYNNGFAAGFVALVLVPVILALKRGKENK